MNYDAALAAARAAATAFEGGNTPADSAPCLEAAPDRSGLIVLVFDTLADEEVSQVRVTLESVSGIPADIASSLTDASGLARFLPVQPLNYTLRLQDLPARLESANNVRHARNVPPGACPVHVFTLPITPRLEIVTLTEWFDPAAEQCIIRYRCSGLAGQAELEVHATGYFEEIAPDQPALPVERPCRTDHPSVPADSCVFQAAAGLLAESGMLEWNGDSHARRGVHAAARKIDARCAPYTVMLRHCRKAADRPAGLVLDPFYVRWQLRENNTWEIDPASCRVSWRLHGEAAALAKLVAGRIIVQDHRGAIVHNAPLTAQHLSDSGVDLAAHSGWNIAAMTREQMPFRVQLQLHTGRDEPDWLALAAMHTQVPRYAYSAVQFAGFNVQSDIYRMDGVATYRGTPDNRADIEQRCRVMIDAIRLAHEHADHDSKVLKIFMAPEFYFRCASGAYRLDEIATIMPRLRQETDRYRYRDWLFVFGTAVGQLRHESEGGSAVGHESTGLEVLAASADQDGRPRIDVTSTLCARIPVVHGGIDAPAIAGQRWSVLANGTARPIVQVAAVGDGFRLTLQGDAIAVGQVVSLIEPVTRELFNLALVQHGWYAPSLHTRAPGELIVYKEFIAQGDIIRSEEGQAWDGPAGRRVRLEDNSSVAALPTDGSRDIGGTARSSGAGASVLPELNTSGLGGGCVFSLHDITYGLEVCRDHYKGRLWKYYNEPGGARAGEPRAQVQLIPSLGISIADAPANQAVATCRDGLVFNVDAQRMQSVARIGDGAWSCNDHPLRSGKSAESCGAATVPVYDRDGAYRCRGCKAMLTTICTTHERPPCQERLAPIGTGIHPRGSWKVPSSANHALFFREGNVELFAPCPLPPAVVFTGANGGAGEVPGYAPAASSSSSSSSSTPAKLA